MTYRNGASSGNDALTEPQEGQIYRDAKGRSFIVLSTRFNKVFVEYADGSTCSISTGDWSEMKASPSRF